MADLSPSLEQTMSQVGGSWDDSRTDRTWRGLKRKRSRRTAVRAGAAAAGMSLVIAGIYSFTGGDESATTAREQAAPTRPVPVAVALAPDNAADIVLHDGAVVMPDGVAEIDVVRSADDVEVRVIHGKARFRFDKTTKQPRRVVAGDVRIIARASEFSVARYEDVTDVWAHHGTLQILWNGEKHEIPAGEHRRYAPLPAEISVEPKPATTVHSDWRPLARDGDYDAAYRSLRKSGDDSVRDHVGDLMLAADVYRISGHARQSVTPLKRVVTRYSSDPRASLAAFTLGRVLLDDLGRPGAAAAAFRKARSFAPSGALSEDALAREVEAWSKAGKDSKARERAEQYLQKYPRGHRVRAVKQYGHL